MVRFCFKTCGYAIWSASSVMIHTLTWSMHSKMLNPEEIIRNCTKMNRPHISNKHLGTKGKDHSGITLTTQRRKKMLRV